MVSINPKLAIPTRLTLPQGNNEGEKGGNEGVKSTTTNGAPYKPGIPVGEINKDALLVNNGIKINKPQQPEEPNLTLNAHFDSLDKWIDAYKQGLIKEDEIHTFTCEDGTTAKIAYGGNTLWFTFEGGVNLQVELDKFVQ